MYLYFVSILLRDGMESSKTQVYSLQTTTDQTKKRQQKQVHTHEDLGELVRPHHT